MENLEKYLFDAVGKRKEEILPSNPYVRLGFDVDKRRLGWLKVYPFKDIKENLKTILKFINDKEYFIFVGMGGSINGIKALLSIFNNKQIYTIDSLDPEALKIILSKIKSFEKLLIIPISKSATTTETQLLSLTLKELFKDKWQEHFLWLTDPNSFEKLDLNGWTAAKRFPIQFDKDTDIGGRFSCPNTLIFFLPLFLLLNKDFKKLEKVYTEYINLQPKIRKLSYKLAKKYSKKKNAYFRPIVGKIFGKSFNSWIVQLFQESLGSKGNLAVKTLQLDTKSKEFLPLSFNMRIKDKVLLLMSSMYFFETFVAFYSAFKNINFVTQEFVEKYKEKMHQLKEEKEFYIPHLDIKTVIEKVKDRLDKKFKFIEVVFFGYSDDKFLKKLEFRFKKAFKDKIIFVFVGSDWNHHSYQAAFSDTETFYVFLIPSSFNINIEPFKKETLEKNIHTLKIICKATHITLEDKSVLFSIDRK